MAGRVDHPVAWQRADELGARVIAAAIEVLEAGGIARFDVPTVANRAGLNTAVVETIWPDQTRLLEAAWTAGLGWQTLIPDTGTLRGDVLDFGEALRQAVHTGGGRALFRSSLPIDGVPALFDPRTRFWDTQFQDALEILRRAGARGELRTGTNPLDAIQMFCSAMYFNTLYLDTDTDQDFVIGLVEVFLHGVTRHPQPDSAAMRQELRDIVDEAGRDTLGEVRTTPDYAHATSAQIRQAILDAAIRETTLRGPELVTRDAIARRVGVTIQVVERMWKTDGDLLLDAGTRARERTRPVPDTGSLTQDVVVFTDSKAKLISTPGARKTSLSALVRRFTGPNDAVITDFWLAGLRETTQICLRAQQRGDLRDGVNPDYATRALVVSLYYDLFFSDSPMRSGYAYTVLDIFLNGVGRQPNSP
jgi:AcrR family transcriptional regulator